MFQHHASFSNACCKDCLEGCTRYLLQAELGSSHGCVFCSGDGRTKLTPVAELLPFEGELLDEESAQREAEAFSEALVPEHAVHAGQPALWWSQSAAQRSSLLVPNLPSRRAGTGLIGQPWGQPLVRPLPLSL